MGFENWNAAARVIAIFAGTVFGSLAISVASWVWLRKQIFAYGGSALCAAGVVLLGLSIWHSVEFGVTATGLNFKAAQEIVASSNIAAKSADDAAKSANKAAELASSLAAKSPTPEAKAAADAAATQAKAASDAANAAAKAVNDVGRALSPGNWRF